MFDPTSRYYQLPDKTLELADGKKITYKGRRLLPALNATAKAGEITLQNGDRLDLLATKLLGDPLRFWQLCDGNDGLNPIDLEKTGQTIALMNVLLAMDTSL